MERRDFIRLSALGLGAGMLAPTMVLAEAGKFKAGSDIFYTKDDPGRWSGKVATHLPSIEIAKTADSVIVKVVTAHEMKGFEHYIVKHALLDKDYKFLEEHLFDPGKDKEAVSSFTLKNYSGQLYVLSLCNKHDLWLNEALV